MSAALVAPSPDAAESRKRRFQSGDCAEEVLPKRRYAEARRLLDWVAHLCLRYPLMTDKVRAPSGGKQLAVVVVKNPRRAANPSAHAGNHASAGLLRRRRRGHHPPAR